MNDSDRIVSKDSIEILSNKPDSPKSFLEIYELGSLCQSKRQYQKALVYAKQGLQLSTELSNQDHKVMALVNIGCIYWEMSQLKKAMEPYLPKNVIYRPKSGFGAPLRHWMRYELRELLQDVLSEDNIKKRGRKYEKNISLNYIDALNQIYNEFFFRYDKSPLLIINTNDIDFVNDKSDLKEILDIIQKPINGTKYYNPNKSLKL